MELFPLPCPKPVFPGNVPTLTRGHGVTLVKKQCRLDIRKFSFSQRTVNEWNILSADYVGVVVLICLKIKSSYT